MKKPLAVLLSAVLLVGCGDVRQENHQTAGEATNPVVSRPQVNWDAPVVNGIEVDAAAAREVAQAPFDVHVPTLSGTLVKVQATDPTKYPEDLRGYGVLFDVPSGIGGAVARVLVEQQLATREDPQFVRNIAANGPGYELASINGVEVALIHPGDRASATFVHAGIRYNVNGPAIPLPVVKALVSQITAEEPRR